MSGRKSLKGGCSLFAVRFSPFALRGSPEEPPRLRHGGHRDFRNRFLCVLCASVVNGFFRRRLFWRRAKGEQRPPASFLVYNHLFVHTPKFHSVERSARFA